MFIFAILVPFLVWSKEFGIYSTKTELTSMNKYFDSLGVEAMASENSKEEIASQKEENRVIPAVPIRSGSPLPMGTSFQPNGVNFSLFSKNATGVTLCLFLPNELETLYEIPLDPEINKTGDVWHIFVENISDGLHYGYYVDGLFKPESGHRFDKNKLLIDPYAVLLSKESEWGNDDGIPLRGVLHKPVPMDWEKDKPPKIPMKEMIIYEMHVRGFTQDPSSHVNHPGTFLGIVEKIPYLKSLGVNAIELLPIHAFNECECIFINPKTKQRLYNYWGYSTINFFSLANQYATDKRQVIREFKTMVAALHQAGIEVILDVVFNHTAEGSENGPTICFKGIENSVYYILGPEGEYYNFSGCGNTFNCNHPVARELIRNSLRYWVAEMHIDGFRFDLASILGRATDGSPLSNPPLLELIALDPVLANTKLIAEAWDAGGLYQVGTFPSWGVWAEWNGKYRDVVRKFIKGDANMASSFVSAICGSSDLYSSGRTPAHSINFITAHDGFTLADLVSYNEKHNLENGEENRDGSNQNDSWNCGEEGPTTNAKLNALRERQIRNFVVALFCSIGVPMIHMGDEYGHTKKGNNNTWSQDNELNWFSWEKQSKCKNFFTFMQFMIDFRKKHPVFQRITFLNPDEIDWHGAQPHTPDWSYESRFVSYTLKDKERGHELYIAFNAFHEPVEIKLPPPLPGKQWHRIVDTQGADLTEESAAKPLLTDTYKMSSYSSIILEAMAK